MDEAVSYQLCTYEATGPQNDPFRARYKARYRTGTTRVVGVTWRERFISLCHALGNMSPTDWHMTVGNAELCEFYCPDPAPFGQRLVFRLSRQEGNAS